MTHDKRINLANFTDLLLDAICVVDAEGKFVFVSAAGERIFGYTPEELVGMSMVSLIHPDDRERTLQAARQIMSGQPNPNFENRYIRKDGRVVHIMWSARWSETDRVRIAVARDITERKRAESVQGAIYAISEIAHTAEDFPSLYQRIHSIIATLLPAENFSVVLYDPHTERFSFPYHLDTADSRGPAEKRDICALSDEVIRTGRPLLWSSPTEYAAHPERPCACEAQPSSWLGVPLCASQGVIGVLVLKSYDRDASYTVEDQELLQYVSAQIATAIERKQLQNRLQHMAQYDDLTDLPNRGLLNDRLKKALAHARRNQGRLALLYLDLDKFKAINDTFGHATGDGLLQAVALRLKECVREVDTVARIGGDEFVILIENPPHPEHVDIVADKLRAAFDDAMAVNGHLIHIRPSIGIAHYPEHGGDAQALLTHADNMMYRFKKNRGHDIGHASHPDPSLNPL